MQKRHHLIVKGQNVAIWFVFGLVIGIGFGAAIDNILVGQGIGLGMGLAIGVGTEAIAKRQGNVI